MMTDKTRRHAVRLAPAFVLIAASAAATVLFPEPIHLVRTIEEPIGGTTVTIEEYCAGNRIVSVRGETVSIIDFSAAAELTEIDRSTATWSKTPLAAVAGARRAMARTTRVLTIRAAGSRQSESGQMLEIFEASDVDGRVARHIEVGVDRQVTLSRDAVETLIGASFPSSHTDVDDVILAASADHRAIAASVGPGDAVFALPVEITLAVTADGETLTTRNTIVRVDRRTVPPELLLIPTGATRVESRLVRFAKEAESLDHPADVHR